MCPKTSTDDILMYKVSSSTNVRDLAVAIERAYSEGNRRIKLRSIGSSSVNQSVKSIAIVTGMLAAKGVTVTAAHSFTTVHSRGADVTAMDARLIFMS